MVNEQKKKGTRWENDAVKLLNTNFPGTWIRVPLSGALGTIVEMPSLKGDIRGKYRFLPKLFIGEAKVGYGGTQMTLRKEWFDKIREEATESFGFPIVVLKFEKARTGSKHIIALDFETWDEIMEEINTLDNALVRAYERIRELQETIYRQARGDGED